MDPTRPASRASRPALDAVRVRFALDDVAARRVVRSLGPGWSVDRRLVTPLRLAATDAGKALALVIDGRPAASTKVQLRIGLTRPVLLRDVRRSGSGPRLVEERNLAIRLLVAELTHPAGGGAGPLTAGHRALVDRCLPAGDRTWLPGVAFEQTTWRTTAAGLPLTVRRWCCARTGMDVTEMGTETVPGEGDLAVLVIAARLRRAGIDPGYDQPWPEQRLRF
jgi:hypothetical protein